jgi:hypothetical protein
LRLTTTTSILIEAVAHVDLWSGQSMSKCKGCPMSSNTSVQSTCFDATATLLFLIHRGSSVSTLKRVSSPFTFLKLDHTTTFTFVHLDSSSNMYQGNSRREVYIDGKHFCFQVGYQMLCKTHRPRHLDLCSMQVFFPSRLDKRVAFHHQESTLDLL